MCEWSLTACRGGRKWWAHIHAQPQPLSRRRCCALGGDQKEGSLFCTHPIGATPGLRASAPHVCVALVQRSDGRPLGNPSPFSLMFIARLTCISPFTKRNSLGTTINPVRKELYLWLYTASPRSCAAVLLIYRPNRYAPTLSCSPSSGAGLGPSIRPPPEQNTQHTETCHA